MFWNAAGLYNVRNLSLILFVNCRHIESHIMIISEVVFSCDQAALQMVFSVCPSVCPSIRLSVRLSHFFFFTIFPSSYHHEIFRSYYQWPKLGPCKRSRSKVKGQGKRGQNPTLPFPDCNSSLKSPIAMKCCTKLETAKERCLIIFQGHTTNFKVTQDKT